MNIDTIEKKNKRKLMILGITIYALMTAFSFIGLSVFLSTNLKALTNGQLYALAVQDWRTAANGIMSGWNFLHDFNSLCILNDQNVLFSYGTCPSSPSFLSGLSVSSYTDTHTIQVSLKYSIWISAIFFPLLIFIPMLFIYWITKTPLGVENYIQIIKSLQNNTNQDFGEISELQKTIKNQTNELIELRKEAALTSMAAQVSHDIRSPLAALEMISSQIGEVPEEKRLIIRNSINRIRDIANSLSFKNDKNTLSSNQSIENLHLIDFENNDLHNELLIPFVDMIVTEKRLQYREKVNIHIEFNQSVESYGLFSKINSTEFKRVLSNVINNSIEALHFHKGQITIELESTDKLNVIIIKDNGSGIPENILTKLGTKGATFNKQGGSGLGLFHAKKTLESWGGFLKINSTYGKETIVRLFIPKQKTPSWFVPSLHLSENSVLVVFDDDQSIHQIWKDRLEKENARNIKVVNLSNPNDFRIFYRKHFSDLDDAVFLMDHEIINHIDTGLDLIEECSIAKQSILVTSRFEEPHVRERCEELGVKLIPKSMSGFVPIEILN